MFACTSTICRPPGIFCNTPKHYTVVLFINHTSVIWLPKQQGAAPSKLFYTEKRPELTVWRLATVCPKGSPPMLQRPSTGASGPPMQLVWLLWQMKPRLFGRCGGCRGWDVGVAAQQSAAVARRRPLVSHVARFQCGHKARIRSQACLYGHQSQPTNPACCSAAAEHMSARNSATVRKHGAARLRRPQPDAPCARARARVTRAPQ
mmetsp:Transcript_37976/g.112435  ORF Transcript_37976/g.112435 Transcript_37976/m.112435 type:complete len:205 (+) Transcript_37976:848-1462(+)